MRILVIEDDKKISSFITNGFKQVGYAVDQPSTAKRFGASPEVDYDAAIVDIMLPQMDGLALVEELPSPSQTIP